MTKISRNSKPHFAAIAIFASLAVAGCQTGPRQAGGTLVGAGLGGLIGSQFGHGSGKLAAVAIGTLGGALLGSHIGRSLDEADQSHYQNAAAQAQTAPVGETITWNNPESGNYGSITPTRDGYDGRTGAYCREYQQEIVVGGSVERGYGHACRQPDGSWKII